MMRRTLTSLLLLLTSASLQAQPAHPILVLGSPAPDFALPGVDGKVHKLSDYAASPVLVVIFTCNHCPIAQMYEQRIEQFYESYGKKGVAVVAIQGNDPKAIRIDELDSSDVSDTLDDMKIRVGYKHLHYPYLYAGDTPSVTSAYGPQATPHVFIFDKTRHLRYRGHFDNSYRIEMVKTHDAQNAVDALLAGKDVPVTHTGVFGCSTKWPEKSLQRHEAERKLRPRQFLSRKLTLLDSESSAQIAEARSFSSTFGPPGADPAWRNLQICKTPTACTAVETSTW